MKYMTIVGTILFTVYGQIVLKWRIGKYGELPTVFIDKIIFLLKLLLDPIIISGFVAAFIASLFWMATMTKFQLSYAYPFMGLSYILVFICSIILFQDSVSLAKIIGLLFIVVGIIISGKSL